jgi:pentatricopeptide repeat protein
VASLLLILSLFRHDAIAFQSPTNNDALAIGRRIRPSTCQRNIFSTAIFLSSSPTSASSSSSKSSISRKNSKPNKESDNQRLQSLQKQATNNPLMSLNLNLDSLAEVGAASRAQELVQRIHALYQEGYYEVSPDVVSYNSVLKAWKEHDKPEKALELLQSMMVTEQETTSDEPSLSSLTESFAPSIQVDVISFNTVITAFANQGNYPKCLQLLREMQTNEKYPDPDIITYNIVLYSLAQSSDRGTAAQAENLLREMLQQQHEKGRVDTTSFNTCIYAWSKEKDAYHQSGISYYSRNSLDAISATSAHRAYELLKIMEELDDAGNVNVHPDIYSYTTTIQAFARSREPEKAQKVLQNMTAKGLQPSRLTYTALMSAFAKAGQPERADAILRDMIAAHEEGDVDELQPDTIAFSSVMDGWAKAASETRPDAADQALKLLEEMKRRGPNCRPNPQTYTSLLTTLAKCATKETCTQARNLLQELEDAYYTEGDEMLRPTIIQYNGTLGISWGVFGVCRGDSSVLTTRL